MSEFIETEFKYAAGSIELEEFIGTIHQLFNIKRKLVISGFDDYFSNSNGDYLRHRYNGDRAELTVKRRLTSESTAQRIEVDLKLGLDQEAEVTQLAKTLGFEPDFSIYKTCFIYWAEDFNIVFYIVYNKALDERVRLVEIEANKNCLRPLDTIILVEEGLRRNAYPNTINPKMRLNESIFERFTTRG